MKNEILLSKLLRLPIGKCLKLYKQFFSETEVDATTYAIHQQASDIIEEKIAIKEMLEEEVFTNARIYIAMMINENSIFSDVAYEELKTYPMTVWIEIIGELNQKYINSLLTKYAHDMPSTIIETLILNLSEKQQAKAIEKYQDRIDSKGELFQTFYYSLGEDGKKKLRELFKDDIKESVVLNIRDLTEQNITSGLIEYKEQISPNEMDDVVEQLLLTATQSKTILETMDLFSERLDEISDMRFKLFITRLKSMLEDEYYTERNIFFDDDEEETQEYDITFPIELYLFNKYKSRFRTLGLKETLSLLNGKVDAYDDNKIGNEILFAFLDIAYENDDLHAFVNNKTLNVLIQKFQEKCQNKDYTIEEFEQLVEKVKTTAPQKLIRDDYIEAMSACGKLMKKGLISNQNPSFIKLRNAFIAMLNKNVTRDGTYLEDINLNGIFHRLIKGTLSFDKVITVKTYRGLIYLSKCGVCINDPDKITYRLSDEQVAKLDIKPLLRWRKEQLKKETEEQNENPAKRIPSKTEFIERMGLQLLCYFGELRAKHILDSGMKQNRMENLFDEISYKAIQIDENGQPLVNKELMEFLFGRGSLSEKNTVMNKIAREELLDFGQYLKEVCNDYEKIKKACAGILTVKRIENHFTKSALPITLKPNEYLFPRPLKEMRSLDPNILNKGIALCHNARKRVVSSIPKVSGKMGNFTYEILELKDPFAIAVGYLSHCCFTVNGESRSALEHSMSSQNGRTFVVYYNGRFLTQSWIWRNGDVVCFDSVEAGGHVHGQYADNLKVLDVYKRAAHDLLQVSSKKESEKECVKAVTIGRSDYRFEGLEKIEGTVPRPLERNVYVYDSNNQWLLAGIMPMHPRYGPVTYRYQDKRGQVHAFLEIDKVETDELDDALSKLQSIKYDATGSEEQEDLSNINQLFVGDDWYIKVGKNGEIDTEILPEDERALDECKQFAKVLGIEIDDAISLEDGTVKNREETVKQLKLTKVSETRRD